MAEIVIAEFLDWDVVAPLLAGRDVLYSPALVDTPDALHAALADAKALVVRNRTQVRGGLLAAAPDLRVVGRLGVGLDNIDMDACADRDIAVFPATGANDLAVAEYVIMATMLLLRGAWTSSAEVAAGSWPRMALINGRETAGKTLGLIGFGAIARETAARARALGMQVAASDPFVAADDPAWVGTARLELDALLATSDVVSLHVPGGAGTANLLDARRIGLMKPGAILINAARGGVLDEEALAAALRSGALGGAALDVFATEPVTAAAGTRFAGLPNLLLTPHIAGVSAEANVRVSRQTIESVLAHLARTS
jgi:(S)-sulfolactate dehydrogenase